MERSKLDINVMIEALQGDVVVAEAPAGLRRAGRRKPSSQPAAQARADDPHDGLVLYVVSLSGVTNSQDELVSGDALLVRPKGTPAMALLGSILDCPVERLPQLLARSGTWSVRELREIDGHRVRFDP